MEFLIKRKIRHKKMNTKKIVGTEPERSVYFGWEKFWNRTRAFGLFRVRKILEPNPNVRSISVAKKNKFEKEKNFDNKINEFGKIIQKIYNQRNYLWVISEDQMIQPNPSVRFISVHQNKTRTRAFGSFRHTWDPNPNVRSISLPTFDLKQ